MPLVLGFLVSLVSDRAPLAPAVARAALRSGRQGGNEELLAALARRSDLPADVIDSLGQERGAKVRAAWLARPDLSSERLDAAVADETRTTVLAAVASSPEASREVLAALVAGAKPKVCSAVAANPAAPDELRLGALAALEPGWDKLGWSAKRALAAAVVEAPGLADHLASNSSVSELLDAVGGGVGLSPEGQAVFLRRLVCSRLDRAAAAEPKAAAELVTQAQRWATRLAGCPVLGAAAHAALSKLVADGSLGSGYGVGEISRQLARWSGGQGGGGAGELVTARSSRDPEVLAGLARSVAGRSKTHQVSTDSNRRLALALTENPAAPAQAVADVMHLVGANAIVAALDARAGGPEEVALYLALCRATPSFLYNTIGRFAEPAPVVRALLDSFVAEVGERRQRALAAVVASDALDGEGVAACPWDALAGGAGLGRRGRAHLGRLLEEGLGEDPGAWETFMVLGASSTSAVGELVHLARMAAAPA